MAVDPAQLEAFRKLEEQMAGTDLGDEFAPFTSIAEVIGYVISSARAGGASEGDLAERVELLATVTDLSKFELKDAVRVLQALGYAPAIVDRLKELMKKAGKAKGRRSR